MHYTTLHCTALQYIALHRHALNCHAMIMQNNITNSWCTCRLQRAPSLSLHHSSIARSAASFSPGWQPPASSDGSLYCAATQNCYTALLHCTAVQRCYTALLNCSAVQRCHTSLLYCAATLYCYTALIYCTATQHWAATLYCNISLHCSTAIQGKTTCLQFFLNHVSLCSLCGPWPSRMKTDTGQAGLHC